VDERWLSADPCTNLEDLVDGDVGVIDVEQPSKEPDDLDGRHRSTPQRPPHSHGERVAYPSPPWGVSSSSDI
jgi:hypothetical protein